MESIIVAIALWCGQPLSSNGYMRLRTIDEVQACRESIFHCLATSAPNGNLDIKLDINNRKCFFKEKLK